MITCSRFADAIAQGNFKTRDKYLMQIIAEEMGDVDDYTNADMQRGKEYEALAVYEYERQNFVKVVHCRTPIVYAGKHKNLVNRIAGTPDGLIGADGVIEVKCRRGYIHLMTKTEALRKTDRTYYVQIQGYLMITDRRYCEYVSYNHHMKSPMLTQRIERDDAFIEGELVPKLEAAVEKLDELKSIYG